MADLHIEDFYRDTALILTRLFNSFPVPTILYVDDVCGPDSPDEFGLPSARSTACFSTMLWLAEHDFLRYVTTIRQEALDQAVLSQRGFLLLTVRPSAAADGSAGDRNVDVLREALRSGFGERIGGCVQNLIAVHNMAGTNGRY
jgi:hypothetical protein